MKPAPQTIHTARLQLRRPRMTDAGEIFGRISSDPEVTRFLSWATHTSLADTRDFIRFAKAQWKEHGIGPYVACMQDSGAILGSVGLILETAYRGSLGFCVAREFWGRGYATEMTLAMVELARSMGVVRLGAMAHPENRASRRVLEKCQFAEEGTLRNFMILKNLDPVRPVDMVSFARILSA